MDSLKETSGEAKKKYYFWLRIFCFFLALFFIAVLGLGFFFQDKLYQSLLDPGIPYQTYEAPPGPDYHKKQSWAAFDEVAGGHKKMAAFILMPALYNSSSQWNASVEDSSFRRRFKRIGLPNYAAPFYGAGSVFVPYYRQASLYAFLTNREDALRARKLAMTDVRQAFQTFLKHLPPDEPFILAGFGQGAFQALALLKYVIAADPHINKRMIVAYIIDAPLPLDLFKRDLAPLNPCKTDKDIHCIVGWGAFSKDEKRNIYDYTIRSMIWGRDGGFAFVKDRPFLCVNPLLWTIKEDYAPARLHKGGVFATGLEQGEKPVPLKAQMGAQCQEGLLIIDRPLSPRLRRPFWFGGRFQTPEYNLFYEDIRVNVLQRRETWMKAQT